MESEIKTSALLKNNKLFHDITDESLERMMLCSKARKKRYQQGALICSQGEKPETIFVLLRGRVAIVRNLSSGKKNILYEVEENTIFGEHYFFGNCKKYWYDVEAITEVEVLQIPWEFFYCFCDDACHHHSQLVKNMLEILSEKEWLAIKKLNVVSHSSLQERIFTWLLDNMDDAGEVMLKMKREEMAAFFGVARPSLSRTLMKLQDERLIEVEKDRIRVPDRERMERLL